MNDYIIYANYYINNNLGVNPKYPEYLNYVCDIQQKALNCIPYDKIVINNSSSVTASTMAKHLTGSIYITNKIFQFKCQLSSRISIKEIENIKKLLYKEGFYYVNYIVSSSQSDLVLSSTKEEHMFNKIMLLSKNEPKKIIEMSI
jgi:hypothetical protein